MTKGTTLQREIKQWNRKQNRATDEGDEEEGQVHCFLWFSFFSPPSLFIYVLWKLDLVPLIALILLVSGKRNYFQLARGMDSLLETVPHFISSYPSWKWSYSVIPISHLFTNFIVAMHPNSPPDPWFSSDPLSKSENQWNWIPLWDLFKSSHSVLCPCCNRLCGR